MLVAHSTLSQWGVKISLRRIERLTYYFGSWGINQRDLKLYKLEQGTLSTGSVLINQRVGKRCGRRSDALEN